MKTAAQKLSPHCEELLYRYASRIVKHKLVAIIIVEDVSAEYASRTQVSTTINERRFLKAATLKRCRQWMDAKDNVLTAREPKDPT